MQRRGLFLSLSIFLILIPVVLFSYDENTTHPGLTSEIVEFYNASFPKRAISAEEKKWIVQGSMDEDTWPRWINHFYDPVYNQGWTAEGFGTISSSTGRWLNSILLSDHPPLASKYWAQSPSTQAEYKDFGGNQTWQRALASYASGDKQAAFLALGHILHLLEDATVPEHTRNDTHAHPLHLFTGDDGSPYEKYAKRYSSKTVFPINAASLVRAGVRPVALSTLTAYFNALAFYSNTYFFSKDTVQTAKYALPVVIRSDNDYGYGKDRDGSIFPLARKVAQRKADFSWATAFVLNDVVTDQVILEAYFDRLSRAAIVHGAGVVQLFFNQALSGQVIEQPTEVSGVHSILADVTKVRVGVIDVATKVQQLVSNVVPAVDNQPQVLGEKIFPESPVFNYPVVPSPLVVYGGGGGGGVVSQPIVFIDASIPVVTTSTIAVTTTVETVVVTSTEPIVTVTSTPVAPIVTSTSPVVTTTVPIVVVTTTIPMPTSTPVLPVVSHDPVYLNGRQTTTLRTLTKAEGPYMLVYYEIPVGMMLAMEPGTIVKSLYNDSKIDIFGSLTSNGVDEDMVILTSGRDKQTSDGLAFGNWNGSSPQAKDWQGLWFHTGSSGVLYGMEMRYAGKSFRVNNFLYTGFVSQAIRVESSDVRFDGVHFLYDGDVAVRLENSSATIVNTFFDHGVRAVESLLTSVVMDTVTFVNFSEVHGPVYLRDMWPTMSNVILENNTADVVYVESALVTSTARLASAMIYYLNNITVAAGATMNIDSGSLVYIADTGFIQVNGTLVAEGTDSARIHFRSYVDKTFWGALRFDGGHGRLSQVVLEDGNYNFPTPAERGGMIMLLNGSDVLIDDSVVSERRNPGNTIYVNHSTLVMNNSSIGQNDHAQFANVGILIDEGTVSLAGVMFENLQIAIKVVSLPLPSVLVSDSTFEAVDYVSDPPGIFVP